ncbi:efflux RND transporter permease subunit [Thiobacillus sp. 65-1402]|uniref:efflux RND transporter permease subunit n=1 Tax=Thiobacillus sp. 65-1402 TaxID=1895861 RepID=UPI00095FFB9A|nr:efflux RND transporter permease subunit [Thiobacillus sp. 65-1402]OJW99856.1 MAG: heavy metal resistance protein CzcA [Thiobacillus sp. 65-1402]
MFDWAIRWSLRNRLTVVLLYLILAGASIVAALSMAVDVFPEYAPPQVQIQTEVPGYSAKDVETLVTRPIEIVLQGAPYIDQIRSNSSVGLSRITIVFKWGIDIYRARQIIQERMQTVQGQLPSGAQAPQMMPVTSAVSWLLKFGLVDWSGSDREHELRTLVDWDIRNRLLAQPGVASVVAVGGGVKQYQVLLDPLRMRKYGVSTDMVAQALRSANLVAPGGFVYPSSEEEYFIRANGKVESLRDVADTLVAMRGGQPIHIGDVGEVRFGSEVKRGDGQIYGGPAVIGTVSKLWGADTMETTRNVEKVLASMAENLPKDVQLIPNVFRQASFIDASIDNLRDALLHSSIIVALVLLLFLFRWRPTAISLIAIPTSLMAGVLVLWALDISINALTLGGLVFAIGEVVDDAIIDVENILRRLRENKLADAPLPALDIVYEGSREIRNSVVFATLIILVAFTPIFFLQGIEGRIFQPMAIAYLAAIASSLIVAITLVPVLSYYLMGKEQQTREYGLGPISEFLLARYRRLLQHLQAWPLPVAASTLVLLVAAAVTFAGLGRSFIPPFHEGNLVIATTMMPGTSLEENLRMGREVEKLIGEMPEVASLAQRAGRSRLDEDAQPVNFSEFDIALKPGTPNVPEVMQRIREQLAQIPGMSTNVSQFITHRMSEILSGVRSQVAVKLYGQDFAVLQQKQQEIYQAVQGVAGIVDLQMEPMILVPGVDVHVDRADAAAYGFTPASIVAQVEQAFNGVTASKVLEQDRTFDLFLRVNEAARADIRTLGEMPLISPEGVVVPLRDLARIKVVQEPYMINRDSGARRAVVQWNTEGRDLDGVVREAQARIKEKVELPPGYALEIGGDFEGQQRATRNLLLSGSAALVLMTLIMFQAFRQWSLVMLVMLNLPFALIGGVFALALAGETLNVSSMIGMVALFGVATRNSLLLISRYQHLMQAQPQLSMAEIAVKGACDRLVPILLTALTAALAVTPLILGDPTGKEMERPLAIVLLGGMLSSTLLNLVVIPILFRWLATRWPDRFVAAAA